MILSMINTDKFKDYEIVRYRQYKKRLIFILLSPKQRYYCLIVAKNSRKILASNRKGKGDCSIDDSFLRAKDLINKYFCIDNKEYE